MFVEFESSELGGSVDIVNRLLVGDWRIGVWVRVSLAI